MANYTFSLKRFKELKNKLLKFFQDCFKNKACPLLVITRYVFFRMYGKKILVYQRFNITGLKNIEIAKTIRIGMVFKTGLILPEKALCSIYNKGKIRFLGDFSLGIGSKINVEKAGAATFGNGVYVNSGTSLLIAHELEVGNNSIISWDCQIMDENFHEISYSKQKQKNNGIKIGNRVWIGCGVLILNGSVIPDGCVVAARSVVSKAFDEENCLIAGNPAQIVKRNIFWQ